MLRRRLGVCEFKTGRGNMGGEGGGIADRGRDRYRA